LDHTDARQTRNDMDFRGMKGLSMTPTMRDADDGIGWGNDL
jgi:hypothetical protein